jgi:hypothetical protein
MVLPPVRTGLPPFSQSVGSDGLFVATGVWTPSVPSNHLADAVDEDPLSALAGMAGAVTICGATVSTDEDTDLFEGFSSKNVAEIGNASRLNQIHARRDINNLLVLEVMRIIDMAKHLPPHIFSTGDVVYLGEENCPYTVKREGYGDYLQQVRIIKVGEVNSYEAGRWVFHERLYLLEPGDSLGFRCTVTDATNGFRKIPAGTRCRFSGYDQDGDVCIRLNTHVGSCFATTVFFFFEDLQHLTPI